METTGTNKNPNRLIKEKSPYLLQHAYNPVDWYPWSEEAFEKAKREDKPVFLSIGYSTCHWCHVMEKESFEDDEVAGLLNKYFVAVKVDREERPDIDHIYMVFCQAITGTGGWPLTVILTPDKKPIFAGTYFPKSSKYGRPGLLDVLKTVHDRWIHDREEIINAGEDLADAVKPYFQPEETGRLNKEEVLKDGFQSLEEKFDPLYGGFGRAPKFPAPHNLMFLLRYWKWAGEGKALQMVEKTLESMHDGGIYDHIGYGFSRYSVDRKWIVPHFEKMLYDNALLAIAYLEGFQATGKERYARVAREIFSYILRDMTSPEGAFYSAEDADSEGEEGKFYVWSAEEIIDILGKDLGSIFCSAFNVTKKGNFEGKNVLNRVSKAVSVENFLERDRNLEEILTEAREKLFAVREKRVHPYKDDKVLTAWNGLMIAALAMGSRILREPLYLKAASRAADFIWHHLRNEEGRLLARYRDGESGLLAYLNDYAYLIWALLELYQSSMNSLWLERALELQKEQNRLFWDPDRGGYFFYGNDGEKLISRPKETRDGATPAGNSVSAINLLRLARLSGREELGSMAETIFQSFAKNIESEPDMHAHFLNALLHSIIPGKEVVIAAGKKDREQVSRIINTLSRKFIPEVNFLFRLMGEENKQLEDIVPFTGEMVPQGGKVTYYICQNFACQRPTTDLQKVLEEFS